MKNLITILFGRQSSKATQTPYQGFYLSDRTKIRSQLEKLVKELRVKQQERALAMQDKLQMCNKYYADMYHEPWFIYIELSDIVIMLEDYPKIFEYLGLLNILKTQSKPTTKKFKLKSQRKTMYCKLFIPEFQLFTYGDYKIYCFAGSRHILVTDRNLSSNWCIPNKTNTLFHYTKEDKQNLLSSDTFYYWINQRQKPSYTIKCRIKGSKIDTTLSSAELGKTSFCATAQKLRKKFFERGTVYEETNITNIIRHRLHKLLDIRIQIPEELLSC